MPATPASSSGAWSAPHQARVAERAEVGEDAGAGVVLGPRGPDLALDGSPVRAPHEVAAGQARLVDRLARLLLRVRVHDHHGAQPLRPQVGEQARGVGEALLVPGQRPEALQRVDVEPERVGRDAPLPELARQLAQPALGKVAVAALLVAQGPQRGQGHAPRQGRVALQHLARRGAVDDVGVELAPLDAHGQAPGPAAAHVEAAAVALVQEDAVGAPLAQHHVEGDRDVERVGAGVVAVGVAVPHGHAGPAQLPAALVERARLLAQAVDVLVVAQALRQQDRLPRPGQAALGVVSLERGPVGRLHLEPTRVAPHQHAQPARLQHVARVAARDPGRRRLGTRLGQGPGEVGTEGRAGDEAHPHDPLGHGLHVERHAPVAVLEAAGA